MPFEKVPIVHKFGIISHSQRLELQERILKQSYLETIATKKILSTARNPFEVTEDFVQEYNAAETYDERSKAEETARKMIERIKRKAGLRESGVGSHVDLPVAWTELSQLAQCKGQIQDECLNVIITSLDQAPLSKTHIPALFFLAETTLYWLRTDAINQPYLRTGELKLLKMGMLVFVRLFFHHMSGHLQGHEDFKNRLFTYLDGFSDCQDAYSPYPNALLFIRYINEVGRMVIGDSHNEAGEVKEGDNFSTTQKNTGHNTMSTTDSDFFRETPGNLETMSNSSHSGAISSSVHDLSPTLWHSLDVWRCVRQLSGGLTEALNALGNCGMGLAAESWVDGICAMQVLSDSAKANIHVLRTLQNLAKGVPPRPLQSSPLPDATQHGSSTHKDHCSTSKTSKVSYATSSKVGLSDIYEKTEYDSSRSKSGKTGKVGSAETDQRTTPSFESPSKPAKSSRAAATEDVSSRPPATGELSSRAAVAGEVSSKPPAEFLSRPPATGDTGKDSKGRSKTQGTQKTMTTDGSQLYTEPTGHSGWKAELGTTQASGYGRTSAASSVPTYSNKINAETAGIHGWHWEVAITYAEIMADICLHSATSIICKLALLGNNKDDASDYERISSVKLCPMKSAGLLDLVHFTALGETRDGGPNDWSWRVRYVALQGLVKICRCYCGDSTKEGVRTVAWNALIKAHSMEQDNRVLEALKVGQMDANIENLLSKHLAVPPSTIGAKVAAGLSNLYLPPLPKAVREPTIRRRPAVNIQINKPFRKKPLRTSLKEEISLASALYEPPVQFAVKTGYDLRRIVEDQWRKELQIQLDEADKDRTKTLLEKQTEEEEEERRTQENKEKRRQNKSQNPSLSRINRRSSVEGVQGSSSSADTFSTKNSFGVKAGV